jgi:hypothetical protein
MSNKKQSSVEWLIDELWNTPKDKFDWHLILRQAKEMHKEEVEQYGAMCCLRTTQKNQWSLEGLYKETFEGQDNDNHSSNS